MDKVFVNFGNEILKIIPGRVSTEVDARCDYFNNIIFKKDRFNKKCLLKVIMYILLNFGY